MTTPFLNTTAKYQLYTQVESLFKMLENDEMTLEHVALVMRGIFIPTAADLYAADKQNEGVNTEWIGHQRAGYAQKFNEFLADAVEQHRAGNHKALASSGDESFLLLFFPELSGEYNKDDVDYAVMRFGDNGSYYFWFQGERFRCMVRVAWSDDRVTYQAMNDAGNRFVAFRQLEGMIFVLDTDYSAGKHPDNILSKDTLLDVATLRELFREDEAKVKLVLNYVQREQLISLCGNLNISPVLAGNSDDAALRVFIFDAIKKEATVKGEFNCPFCGWPNEFTDENAIQQCEDCRGQVDLNAAANCEGVNPMTGCTASEQ